jgi:hypothetical protein
MAFGSAPTAIVSDLTDRGMQVGTALIGQWITGTDKSNRKGVYALETTIFNPFNVLEITLLVISMTLVLLTMVYKALTLLASADWHRMASVGWHG